MTAAASKLGVTSYTTPSDVEIAITRTFDAPRRILYDAWTKPEHIQSWLTGPEGWTMPVCEVDLRPGGAWRWVYRRATGTEMTLTGTYVELSPPDRIVMTESWGKDWPDTINTIAFTESGNQTTVTQTVRYVSKEVRDAALGTGMKDGVDASYARLDAMLERMA